MRILMACAAFPPFIDGGGPISALLLARMLQDEGHDVRVLNAGDHDADEMIEGVPVRRIAAPNVYWNYRVPRPTWKKLVWHGLENGNPRAFSAMRREIRAFAPDILLTDSIENINVATWAAARSLGVPVAHTIRSAFLLCWRGVMQRQGVNCDGQCLTCWTSALGKRFFSRFVDGVCGESDDVISRHVERGYFPNALVRRIPGAIERIVAEGPRAAPRDRPLRIGFIGVHTRFKGLDVFGRAAARLVETLPEASVAFHVAGTGNAEDEARLTADFPRDHTRFWGWVDPQDFFPEIDLLVFPSVGHEAFGRVAVEAFAHAVPVVGSDLGGIAETVRDGVNGLLFPAADDAALADRLTRVARDPDLYDTLSRGAHAAAHAYLRPTIAGLYTQFLQDTMTHHHARPIATDEREVAL